MLVRVMSASGMAEPLGSLMLPEIEPVKPWPAAMPANIDVIASKFPQLIVIANNLPARESIIIRAKELPL
jgi:hypothetical protein